MSKSLRSSWVCKNYINQSTSQQRTSRLDNSRALPNTFKSPFSTSSSLLHRVKRTRVPKRVHSSNLRSFGGYGEELDSNEPLPDPENPHPPNIPVPFNSNWDSRPPSKYQLKRARAYFQHHPAKFLWSAPKFHSMDFGSAPEVAFLGRSNVGKSSLLNAILGVPLAHTSSKRGRTRAMNAFSVGADDSTGDDGKKLVVLDMPGYGKGGRAEWGTEIMKYLEKRKQFKRAFMLVDAEHGLKPADMQMLALFRERDIPHQIILSKADKVLTTEEKAKAKLPDAFGHRFPVLSDVMQSIFDKLDLATDNDSMFGEFVACSTQINMGMEAVQFAVLRACGMEEKTQEIIQTHTEQRIIPYDEIVWKDEEKHFPRA